MQVAPIASGSVSAQLLTITNPVSNVAAASPAEVTDTEAALRVKEQQASMTAQKIAETQGTQITQDVSASGSTQTLQRHGTDEPSQELNSADALKADRLQDYLDKSGSDGRSLSPTSIMSSGVKSFVGIVENAQKMLGGKNGTQADRAQDVSGETAAPAQIDGKPAKTTDPASMDHILDRYVSISWASFSASLATSSVAAASTSVNTLVKQQ
ncbi:hypothetical protein F9K97_23865 [Brucella anthropi]|uniref:hypothetical protein n=1 Tax=Brucella anthropi TaxID=529 RepID=UPI00124F690B|nr:hypothetical protein [Brucella anthropi]KAB2736257.1 hypothetical protein F9K89_17035 [Brucella anthropi]KAB2775724.1 hypothetical protein F9K97_23865 [Brucella anthropi]